MTTEPKKDNKKESGASEQELTKIVGLLESLSGQFVALETRIKKVEATAGPANATEATDVALSKAENVAPKPEVVVDETIQERRIDPRYRKMVTDILGEQFEAWEEYSDCPPSHFRFVINVPPGLSSIPKNTHTRTGCDHDNPEVGCKVPPDLRSKTMTYAEGENGVKEWCNRVRLNLNKYYTTNALPSPFSNQ